MIEKCIKLTADLSAKQSDCKALENDFKKKNDSLASLQVKINGLNNKLAESEVSRIRLQDFNSQLSEICKGSKVIEELKKDHENELAAQKEVFKDTKAKESQPPLKHVANKVDKKCWHYENGFCKKGDFCNYLHPHQICEHFKRFGECPQGIVCPSRHPLTICTAWTIWKINVDMEISVYCSILLHLKQP